MKFERLQKKAQANGFRLYDYYIDNMHTENKYYLVNENNNIFGCDRLVDVDELINELVEKRDEKLKRLDEIYSVRKIAYSDDEDPEEVEAALDKWERGL